MINIGIILEYLTLLLDWLNANSAAITAISGAISATLTALLVWLYFQQKKIQEKLTEAEHSPEIVHEDIYLTWGDTRHMINYVLKNVGNGPATNLRQRILVEFEHEHVLPNPVETQLKRPGDEYYMFDEDKNYIEPGRRLQFTAHYGGECVEMPENDREEVDNLDELRILQGDENLSSLEGLLRSLQKRNVSVVHLKIIILYDTIIEENMTEDIVDEEIDLNEWVEDGSESLFAEESNRKQISE